MSLPSTFSSVIIEGNTVDQGIDASGSYQYTAALNTTADCIITNNIFSGIATAGGGGNVMLDLNNCSCNITNNNFIRNTTTLAAYIRNTGSNDHIITDNIFDSPTVDGYSEALTTGLTYSSVYTKNKNQTGTALFSLYEGFGSFGGAASTIAPWLTDGSTYNVSINDEVNDASNYLNITDSATSGGRQFTRNINISNRLPPSVTILECKVGYVLYGSGSLTTGLGGGGFVYLGMNSSIPTDNIMDVFAHETFGSGDNTNQEVSFDSKLISTSGDQAIARGSTQYLTFVPITPSLYTPGINRNIELMFELSYTISTAGITWIVSPVKIRYRW